MVVVVALAQVIGGMLPADETAGLRSLFLEIDKDRSGCVTLHELGVALRRKGHASTHQELAALMQVLAGGCARSRGAAMVPGRASARTWSSPSHWHQLQRRGTRCCGGEACEAAPLLCCLGWVVPAQGVDQNGDGVLDWSEFLAAMLHRGKLLQEARLKAAFAQLDADGDGALSRDDLATVRA